MFPSLRKKPWREIECKEFTEIGPCPYKPLNDTQGHEIITGQDVCVHTIYDTRDKEGVWYEAKVLQIEHGIAYVRFLEFPESQDEVIPLADTDRFAPRHSQTKRRVRSTSQASQQFRQLQINDPCDVRGVDQKWHAGTVVGKGENSYTVTWKGESIYKFVVHQPTFIAPRGWYTNDVYTQQYYQWLDQEQDKRRKAEQERMLQEQQRQLEMQRAEEERKRLEEEKQRAEEERKRLEEAERKRAEEERKRMEEERERAEEERKRAEEEKKRLEEEERKRAEEERKRVEKERKLVEEAQKRAAQEEADRQYMKRFQARTFQEGDMVDIQHFQGGWYTVEFKEIHDEYWVVTYTHMPNKHFSMPKNFGMAPKFTRAIVYRDENKTQSRHLWNNANKGDSCDVKDQDGFWCEGVIESNEPKFLRVKLRGCETYLNVYKSADVAALHVYTDPKFSETYFKKLEQERNQKLEQKRRERESKTMIQQQLGTIFDMLLFTKEEMVECFPAILERHTRDRIFEYRGTHQWSFLHVAVAGNHTKLVAYLLKKHPMLIRVCDDEGHYPFTLAIKHGCYSLCPSLLQSYPGVIYLTNRAGESAFQIAAKKQAKEVLRMIMEEDDKNWQAIRSFKQGDRCDALALDKTWKTATVQEVGEIYKVQIDGEFITWSVQNDCLLSSFLSRLYFHTSAPNNAHVRNVLEE